MVVTLGLEFDSQSWDLCSLGEITSNSVLIATISYYLFSTFDSSSGWLVNGHTLRYSGLVAMVWVVFHDPLPIAWLTRDLNGTLLLLIPILGTVCPNMSVCTLYICFLRSLQGFPLPAFLPMTFAESFEGLCSDSCHFWHLNILFTYLHHSVIFELWFVTKTASAEYCTQVVIIQSRLNDGKINHLDSFHFITW